MCDSGNQRDKKTLLWEIVFFHASYQILTHDFVGKNTHVLLTPKKAKTKACKEANREGIERLDLPLLFRLVDARRGCCCHLALLLRECRNVYDFSL